MQFANAGNASLQELHVGNNAVRTVCAEMLSNLISLSVLDLRDNRIDALPDEIGLCQTLERLDLTNNSLSALVTYLIFPHIVLHPMPQFGCMMLRVMHIGVNDMCKSKIGASFEVEFGFDLLLSVYFIIIQQPANNN